MAVQGLVSRTLSFASKRIFRSFDFIQGPQGPQGVQGERGQMGEGLPGPKVSWMVLHLDLGKHEPVKLHKLP